MTNSVVSILEYMPVAEKMLMCNECKEPWVEILPVKASPHAVLIDCPYCGKAEGVKSYVQRRIN